MINEVRNIRRHFEIEPKTEVNVASDNWQSMIFSLSVLDISISLIQMCNLLCYTLKSKLQGLFTSIKVKWELKKLRN